LVHPEAGTTKDGAAVKVGMMTTGDGPVLAVHQDDGWFLWHRPAGSAIATSALADLLSGLGGDGQVGDPVSPGRLLPPLLPHRNVMCLGKNYRAHAAEFSAYAHESDAVPDVPIVFTKPAAALCGACDDIMVDPEITGALDYEAELGVVIGLGGSRIAAHEAIHHVAGYTVVNDVTARDLQQRHKQWFLGKSLAAATPTGPVIVSADEMPDLGGRAIRCWVNGELRQDATLSEMIFGVPETIAAISRIFPLEPGDLIAMGTPSGVGVGFDPPRFLQDGDQVVCEIEGIGRLENTIRFVAAPQDALKEPAHA
jgi:2-keto-4-pentenoate hydratase/2-oxohepta-3-ene-1,7-dioic acid hydratase in catechol pathway